MLFSKKRKYFRETSKSLLTLNSSNNRIISDPSRFEESIADAVVTFGINTSGELCLLNMGGDTLITTAMLVHISKIAHRRAKAVLESIEDTITKAAALEKENKINVGLSSLTIRPPIVEKKFNIHLRDFSYKVKTGIDTDGDAME